MRVMARAAAPTSGAGRIQPPPDVPEARPMAAIAADRSLLFGLLSLQNGLIDHVQLVAAFQSWTRDKVRPLAEHLDAEQRSLLEGLVAQHLKKHGGDVEESLAAVPAARSIRDGLADLGDPDIGATLR